MSVSYDFSLTSDFPPPHELDVQQLINRVVDSKIETKLSDLQVSGDTVSVIFEAKLSESEVTILNGIIAVFVPDIDRSRYDNVTSHSPAVASTDYKVVADLQYPGTRGTLPLVELSVISRRTAGASSYTVRVWDATNSLVVASATFSSDDKAVNNLGSISNLPKYTARFEVQAKGDAEGVECSVLSTGYVFGTAML